MTELVRFYRPYKGWIEIVPSECGKTDTVMESFTVPNGHGKELTIVAPFVHDCYTFAPNLKDPVPAIAHDFARIGKRWNDGTEMTWWEWNDLLRYLMSQSWDRTTRWMAWVYCVGASSFDWVIWMQPATSKLFHR